MTTNTKIFISLVLAVVIGGAIAGAYYYPQNPKPESIGFGTSTQGATFTSAKQASVAINLSAPGANATSSSILNTDASDRYVSALKIGCENVGTSKTAYTGTGLANLLLTVGTSTTATSVNFVGANNVATSLTVATTSGSLLFASSTLAIATSTYAAIWPAGTYMNFNWNATNTASCTVGVDYFPS